MLSFTIVRAHFPMRRDIDVGFQLRLVVQLDRPLGDILRQIADSLEFGGDFHRRRHQPQVSCGRLMEGQQPDTVFIDLHIQRVDLVVPLDHPAGQGRVARDQRGEGLVDLIFRQPGHSQELGLQLGEFFVKVAL